ncbi:uncharacterized protein LOC124637876 [Helicoverpa zea]|uniref:uncharacterized protein LOC124637876 n=1 Tax=Helicoverpa zea TaxID=7113 RepID=UPI000B38A5C2|nr:uncharacterized protein LOC110372863 [Helicoverpa armigera]XP_047030558.1 uncharacterized protein LOC124637876 [Helicoverpa zea]PZC81499.1 hypothetical protein B5X24_HaOG212704 [Helicoverpa armigera]
MCGGCSAACGNQIGNVVYVLEKLASFAALTAIVLCIITTVAISLGLGVGLGYNYCYVDLKVMTEEPLAANSANLLRTMEEPTDLPPNFRRSQGTSARRTMALPPIKNTMALPLNGEYDFPSLISKLRSRNKNVTLELIT